jgi:hypothetical protein
VLQLAERYPWLGEAIEGETALSSSRPRRINVGTPSGVVLAPASRLRAIRSLTVTTGTLPETWTRQAASSKARGA